MCTCNNFLILHDTLFLAPTDNYIIFGFFTLLGVLGIIMMLFIAPTKQKRKVRSTFSHLLYI